MIICHSQGMQVDKVEFTEGDRDSMNQKKCGETSALRGELQRPAVTSCEAKFTFDGITVRISWSMWKKRYVLRLHRGFLMAKRNTKKLLCMEQTYTVSRPASHARFFQNLADKTISMWDHVYVRCYEAGFNGRIRSSCVFLIPDSSLWGFLIVTAGGSRGCWNESPGGKIQLPARVAFRFSPFFVQCFLPSCVLWSRTRQWSRQTSASERSDSILSHGQGRLIRPHHGKGRQMWHYASYLGIFEETAE